MKPILTSCYKRVCLTVIIQFVFLFSVLAQGFSPDLQARLQHIIDSFQNNPANPYVGGMAVAINVDGLALWEGSTGYASRNIDAQNNLLPGGTPFTGDLLSRIYSVTKTFTSALVLELAQEGKFNLDATVSSFIPLHLVNSGLNPAVTLRQLLAHESGYSDYTEEYMLQLAVAFQPTRVWTPFETISFTHQISAPGAVRDYSSTNYIMLGAIVEAVTGKRMEQHYRERFFAPLEFSSMYLGVRESHGSRPALVAPHDNISPFNPIFQLTGQPTFPNAYTNISRFPLTAITSLAFTGGGIVSNVAEMAEWGNALFGGRATSASTLQTMMNSISSTPDVDADYLGYGVTHNKKISTSDYFIGHDGNAPGYKSVMMYQPDRKMTMAIVSNYHGSSLYRVAKVLYEALPRFLCGNSNRKEDKIMLCYKGTTICIAREAAPVQIAKGAYLGSCEDQTAKRMQTPIVITDELLLTEAAGFSAFPNPFSQHLNVRFKIAETGLVNVRLFDLNGKMVNQLFQGEAPGGMVRQFTISSQNLPAGTYICRLQTSAGVSQLKIILSR
jgi:D-alanyl-D-alanine carboxypeptidase